MRSGEAAVEVALTSAAAASGVADAAAGEADLSLLIRSDRADAAPTGLL